MIYKVVVKILRKLWARGKLVKDKLRVQNAGQKRKGELGCVLPKPEAADPMKNRAGLIRKINAITRASWN